jgi:hypothetical protein
MKILSIILIIAYLMLPALCFSHPCEGLSAKTGHLTAVSADSGECPFNNEADNCETTCCCAGHVPLSIVAEIEYVELASKLSPYESHRALPRILDRIIVPPQNLSC